MFRSIGMRLVVATLLPVFLVTVALYPIARSPYRENLFQRDRTQLGGLFGTLLTHFGRYTRLTLFDGTGRTWLSAGIQRRPSSASGQTERDDLQDTITLPPRSVYVSQRLGVLVFTLDWQYLASDLPHTLKMDADANVLLVDAALSRRERPSSGY